MAVEEWHQRICQYVMAPIAYILLLLLIPPYILIKIFLFIKGSIYPENLAGKVVLITGASSGIGEYMAYAYAKKGARLALAARRVEKLSKVADKARALGSPGVIMVATDVSKLEQCQNMVNETITHFGQLDHLVCNAGIAEGVSLEEVTDFSKFVAIMDVNFWGTVYSTKAALPHIRKNKGKIVAVASGGVWASFAKLGFYNGSKAAMVAFFEVLRTEEPNIGIMIVTPGVVESEMTVDDKLEPANMHVWPKASTEKAAEAMVNSACRGDRYSTEPNWALVGYYYYALIPESIQWINYFINNILVPNINNKKD